MQVSRRQFSEIIPDNEDMYFLLMCGLIESIDELSHVEIVKLSSAYHVRVAPSTPSYTEPLLQELLKFNNMFGIKLSLSKSIKNSSTLAFEINLL